jgi:hypothetical protein
MPPDAKATIAQAKLPAPMIDRQTFAQRKKQIAISEMSPSHRNGANP